MKHRCRTHFSSVLFSSWFLYCLFKTSFQRSFSFHCFVHQWFWWHFCWCLASALAALLHHRITSLFSVPRVGIILCSHRMPSGCLGNQRLFGAKVVVLSGIRTSQSSSLCIRRVGHQVAPVALEKRPCAAPVQLTGALPMSGVRVFTPARSCSWQRVQPFAQINYSLP